MLAGMKRLISAGHAALSVVCLAAAVTAALFPRIAKAAEFPSVTVVATVPEAALDGSATGLLTFARTGDTSNNLTVNYILGGSAAKWTDYYRLPEGDMPVAGTIPAGAASTTLAITARANSTGANPETAVFTLSADPSYSVGAANTAAVTIAAAAAAIPSVSVVATVPNASLDGTATGLLTFSRTGATSGNLAVNYTLGGTAVKWIDYYRLPEGDMPVAVTIPAGAASTTLAITAKGNSTGANPETALFTLSADPSYSVGAANAATVTIVAAGAATAPLSPTVPVASVVPANAAGSGSAPGGNEMDDTNLVLAAVGDHALRVLAPTLLELRQITTKAPDPAIVY